MADTEDLKLLATGALDLSRCDFREANLSGMDLRDRNFTHSLFEKANLEHADVSGSNFFGASVSFMNARGCNFDNCNLKGLHFGYSDLTNSSLRNCQGQETRFQHAKLERANLSGTDFSKGTVDPDTDLTEVVTDKNTSFEELRVLRPTSRNEIFSDYEFNNGLLLRKRVNQVSNPHNPAEPVIQTDVGPHSGIPASDRVVTLNHNDPRYLEITEKLDEAIEAVRTTNEHIDQRDSAIQSLNFAKEIWGRFEISLQLAQVGLVMFVDDALELVGKINAALIIELVKTLIVNYVKSLIK